MPACAGMTEPAPVETGEGELPTCPAAKPSHVEAEYHRSYHGRHFKDLRALCLPIDTGCAEEMYKWAKSCNNPTGFRH